jgi:uncharacterized membrane protein HdeD (DUF308 family)
MAARVEVFVLPRLSDYWWVLVVRGIAATLFGLIALIWPGITLRALVLIFGAYVFVDGIFTIIGAVGNAQRHTRWGGLALIGVISIAAGIATFVWPAITAVALLALIAAWAIVTGVLEVSLAIRIRKEVKGEWIIALAGITSILFGAILVLQPSVGALALVILIGFYAIFFGFLMLALGLRVRPREHRSTQPQSAAA